MGLGGGPSTLLKAGNKNRRFIELAGAVALAAILPGLVFGLWLCGWYDSVTPSAAVDDRAGQARGRVGKVEPLTKTIHVSPNLFGIRAVPFTLDEDTRIVVGDKEGGFGDFRDGVLVKIVYQRRPPGLVVSCVELFEPRPTASTALPSDGCRPGGSLGHRDGQPEHPVSSDAWRRPLSARRVTKGAGPDEVRLLE